MCFYVFFMPLSFNVLLNCVLFSPNHWSSKMEITFYCYSVALFLGGYYFFQTLPYKLKLILFLKFLFPFISFLFFFSFKIFYSSSYFSIIIYTQIHKLELEMSKLIQINYYGTYTSDKR